MYEMLLKIAKKNNYEFCGKCILQNKFLNNEFHLLILMVITCKGRVLVNFNAFMN